MFEFENFSLFLIASLLLNLAPGNDMLFVFSRTLSHGTKGGIYSAIGVFLGCVFHIVLAAVGLSALIMKFSIAYDIIRYAGAVYLIYLGIKTILSKVSFSETKTEINKTSNRNLILHGVITDVLNPKVALFFLAFIPQFVNPDSHYVWAQFLALGFIFNVQGTLMLVFFVLIIGKTTSFFKNTAFWRYMEKITGFILIGLGLNIAWDGRR